MMTHPSGTTRQKVVAAPPAPRQKTNRETVATPPALNSNTQPQGEAIQQQQEDPTAAAAEAQQQSSGNSSEMGKAGKARIPKAGSVAKPANRPARDGTLWFLP